MKEKKIKKTRRKRNIVPSSITVNVSRTRFPIIEECCTELGYRITESSIKNLLFWCDAGGSFEFISSLSNYQFCNHFPGTWSIARKIDLARNIAKMSKALPNLYTFHPKSFILPAQFSDMEAYMNSIQKVSKRTFIVKPDKGSFGRGIVLVQNPGDISDYFLAAIAQQYIKPYLIDGLKFDLRIYALVVSIDPLRIYLHEEGMARFCTEKYEKPKEGNLELCFSHLTNYALNKNNPNFQQPTEENGISKTHKRSMTNIFTYMKENDNVDIDKLKKEIEDIIRLTMISVQPYIASNYRTVIPINDGKSRCFEILGFDILIDKYHKPWLLEVNWSPSFADESPFDVALKKRVIKGALKIVNIPSNFKSKVKQRRKSLALRRPSEPIWSEKEELEIAKTTQYKLIYPLNPNDQSYEETEIAFAESRNIFQPRQQRALLRAKSMKLNSSSSSNITHIQKQSSEFLPIQQNKACLQQAQVQKQQQQQQQQHKQQKLQLQLQTIRNNQEIKNRKLSFQKDMNLNGKNLNIYIDMDMSQTAQMRSQPNLIKQSSNICQNPLLKNNLLSAIFDENENENEEEEDSLDKIQKTDAVEPNIKNDNVNQQNSAKENSQSFNECKPNNNISCQQNICVNSRLNNVSQQNSSTQLRSTGCTCNEALFSPAPPTFKNSGLYKRKKTICSLKVPQNHNIINSPILLPHKIQPPIQLDPLNHQLDQQPIQQQQQQFEQVEQLNSTPQNEDALFEKLEEGQKSIFITKEFSDITPKCYISESEEKMRRALIRQQAVAAKNLGMHLRINSMMKSFAINEYQKAVRLSLTKPNVQTIFKPVLASQRQSIFY